MRVVVWLPPRCADISRVLEDSQRDQLNNLRRELRGITATAPPIRTAPGERRARRVYVIQVRGRERESPLGALYVGQSKLAPEHRLGEHQRGFRGAVGLRGNCWRLRPELFDDLPPQPSQDAAVRFEWDRARALADAGFRVQCNGCNYAPARRGQRKLFGVDYLATLSPTLRRDLVRGVVATGARARNPEIVNALRWRRDPDYGELPGGEFVQEFVGRLAHVEIDAVARMVGRILGPDLS